MSEQKVTSIFSCWFSTKEFKGTTMDPDFWSTSMACRWEKVPLPTSSPLSLTPNPTNYSVKYKFYYPLLSRHFLYVVCLDIRESPEPRFPQLPNQCFLRLSLLLVWTLQKSLADVDVYSEIIIGNRNEPFNTFLIRNLTQASTYYAHLRNLRGTPLTLHRYIWARKCQFQCPKLW